MIVPETCEQEWLRTIGDLPPFEPKKNPIVLVSPHPDDETLGAGGLIASHCQGGADVIVVAVTDGENAYEDNDGLAETRIREQREAVATLSSGRAILVRLGLTDSDVSAQTQSLIDRLTPFVKSETHLVAPWTGDFHPDHEACGRAALEVARRSAARLTWYFFWTWHRGTPKTIQDLALESLPLGDSLLELKLKALQCHRSQLEHVSGNPILPSDLLAPARRKFEVFARA